MWHRVDASSFCARAQSGSGAFYFGRERACDYDDGLVKDFSLTSPSFAVSSATDALTFWYLYEIESKNPDCYDQMRVEISRANGPWTLLRDLGPASVPVGGGGSLKFSSGGGLGKDGQWMYAQAGLGAYSGSTVQVRFRFMSGADGLKPGCGPPDAENDNFLGFYVDNVSLACALPPAVLAKSVSPAYAARNDTVTYTLSYTNNGAAPEDLSLWDTLPTGAHFVTATASGLEAPAGFVSWNLSAVPASATASVSLVVSVDGSQAYPSDWLNQAGVSLAPGKPFISNKAAVMVRPSRLTLRKVARPATLDQGDDLSYDIVVTNESAQKATGLVIQDSLPSGFVFNASEPPGDGSVANGVWFSTAYLYLDPGASQVVTLNGTYTGPPGLVRNQAFAKSANLAWTSAWADVQVGAKSGEVPGLKWVAVYPNPAPSAKGGFKPQASVVYDLLQPSHLKLNVYTVAGELVKVVEKDSGAGRGQIAWDLRNSSGAAVSFGMYVLVLNASSSVSLNERASGTLAVVW